MEWPIWNQVWNDLLWRQVWSVWRIFWQRLIDDFGGMGIQRQIRIIGVGIRCGRIRGVFWQMLVDDFFGLGLGFPF